MPGSYKLQDHLLSIVTQTIPCQFQGSLLIVEMVFQFVGAFPFPVASDSDNAGVPTVAVHEPGRQYLKQLSGDINRGWVSPLADAGDRLVFKDGEGPAALWEPAFL